MSSPNIQSGAAYGVLKMYFLALGSGNCDAIEDEITEGRCHERPGGHKYSSCGDYASWAAYNAGARNLSAINRVEANGGWVIGANIDMMVSAGSVPPPYDVGDFAVLSRPSGGHIGAILGSADSVGTWLASLGEADLASMRDMGADFGAADRLVQSLLAVAQPPVQGANWYSIDGNSRGGRCVINLRTEKPLTGVGLSRLGIVPSAVVPPIPPISPSGKGPPDGFDDRGTFADPADIPRSVLLGLCCR